jgi:hypothetical protein
MTAWVWWSLAAVPLLWVFFLAVMHLRDAKDDGQLTGPIVGPAYLVLAVGYMLDVLVQFTWASAWFRELPPRRAGFPWLELTVSTRTKRWAATEANTFNKRTSVALRKHALSRFDRTGRHS